MQFKQVNKKGVNQMSVPYCEVCLKNYKADQIDFEYRVISNCKTCLLKVVEVDEVAVKKEKIEALIKFANEEVIYKNPWHWQELIKMLEELMK